MEVYEAVKTRLETREFANRPVPPEVGREVLEAARLSPSAMNMQHWHFILLDKKEDVKRLAEASTTGKWIAGAGFAVVVLTNPKDAYHMLDAGRAITNMQLTAWGRGVGAGIYTGYKQEEMRAFLGVPPGLEVTAVLGFGYPARKTRGKKKRLPLGEVASYRRYGKPAGAS
jgi:nitroreductase